MKDVPDFLAPVQKQLEEDFVEDVVVDHLFEIVSEDIVEFVDDRQHLLQQVGMVRFQDATNTDVEVVVVEIARQLLVVTQKHIEVALYQVQALQNRVSFIQACFGEYQHHKGIQQLFVFNQLHVASSHLLTDAQDSVVVHLSDEN